MIDAVNKKKLSNKIILLGSGILIGLGIHVLVNAGYIIQTNVTNTFQTIEKIVLKNFSTNVTGVVLDGIESKIQVNNFCDLSGTCRTLNNLYTDSTMLGAYTGGYIPYYDGQSSQFKDSTIYTTGGKVGIGITTLSSKFTVQGTSTLSGNTAIKGNTTIDGNATINGTTMMGNSLLLNNISFINNTIQGDTLSGLYINGGIDNGGILEEEDNFTWLMGKVYAEQVHTTHRNIILQADGGNVGIGNKTPQAKLDIIGDTQVNGNMTLTGSSSRIIYFNNTGIIKAGANNNQFVVGKNGNIGIGTATPSEKLEVNGDMKVDGDVKLGLGEKIISIQSTSTDTGSDLNISAGDGAKNGGNLLLKGGSGEGLEFLSGTNGVVRITPVMKLDPVVLSGTTQISLIESGASCTSGQEGMIVYVVKYYTGISSSSQVTYRHNSLFDSILDVFVNKTYAIQEQPSGEIFYASYSHIYICRMDYNTTQTTYPTPSYSRVILDSGFKN